MSGPNRYYFGLISDEELEGLNLEPVTIKPLSVIEKLWVSQLTVGHAGLALTGDAERQSIVQSVSDGDTVRIGVFGNLSTRFLGIDTPEKSFRLLKSRTVADGSSYTGFIRLDKPEWADFLANPFTLTSSSYLDEGGPLPPYALSMGLYEHLQPNLVAEAAENHYQHAFAATKYLEKMIKDDQLSLVKEDEGGNLVQRYAAEEDIKFFLAFAHEVTDGYGRLLCILKPDEPDPPPGGRQESYNLRMLEAGKATPYWIFPNIEPWRKQDYILNAIFGPAEVAELIENPTLRTARLYTRNAREQGKGVFGEIEVNNVKIADRLQLMPHEIRFLAARRPPSRYVIDLSQSAAHAGKLIHPENYYTIPNLEDRLYIPVEYVPLFAERGWQVQQSADG